MVRANRKNDQSENKKKAGEKKEEERIKRCFRSANSDDGASSHGRKKNKSNRGKGKNMELLRKHYGIIRHRQTKITDYLMLRDVRRLARRPNKSHSYCLNCKAQMEGEASRREPAFIDLVSSSDDDDDYEVDEEGG
ncbi:hypothetical protein PRIPAC_87027 [Pristionchus pacificus]|uniref:Uncharacterized protein n=1 Tax=Pristionchus pacificus TaxID=54126 RepID=A0A2A6BS52_PRIPA|nr:hypothetical protein PRIPAC_87027 [Pristionchus pacificus]|eukprot:PDM68708.1 hypothetical protein PRIPAC_47010 [Pristionchus pacificus]